MEKTAQGNSLYRAKVHTVQELEYLRWCDIISQILKQWGEKNKGNKELEMMTDLFTRIFIYVSGMMTERDAFERITSEYRERSLKDQKARIKAEQELHKIKENLKKAQKNFEKDEKKNKKNN